MKERILHVEHSVTRVRTGNGVKRIFLTRNNAFSEMTRDEMKDRFSKNFFNFERELKVCAIF
jgi:hypothetical protein